MKKLTLIAIIAGVFSLNVYADWDPALEAREAAERKAGQQRAAKQKAEHDKMIKDASARAYRQALGKDAVGKSDAEVERIYNNRQAQVLKQAATVEAAIKSSERQPKKTGDSTGIAQGDAAMKAMYGKSVNDIGNMSDKEREAFFKDLEKNYPK